MVKNKEFILASASPRRQELLKKIIPQFKVVQSGIDESSIREYDPIKFVYNAAVAKTFDVARNNRSSIVIGADTIVVLNGNIYGKPKDLSEAKKFLRELSGKVHQVITAVAVCSFEPEQIFAAHSTTDVTFKELTDAEIDSYIKENKVLDKAGSYAIQEIGDKFVTGIKGDHDNVVGLPLGVVKELIRKLVV